MTQHHISHPEGLPACKEGHSARHIHDRRGAAAGGGHFVECCCSRTRKHADPAVAVAEWRRINRPARSARAPTSPVVTNNVVQFNLSLAEPASRRTRAKASAQGGRP